MPKVDLNKNNFSLHDLEATIKELEAARKVIEIVRSRTGFWFEGDPLTDAFKEYDEVVK